MKLMYKAAINGDWAAAKRLLKSDPTLAVCQFRGGNGPLHIAVSFRQKCFARKLIHWMKPEDLMLTDSKGSTACSYAVAYGMIGISLQMMDKNEELLRTISYFSAAMLSKNPKLISYMLGKTGGGRTWTSDDWYELLQMAVASKMHGMEITVFR